MEFGGSIDVDALINSGATDLLLPYDLDKKIMGIHLNVTDSCNMNCEYCFVNKNAKHMTRENAFATMDWLLSDAVSAKGIDNKFYSGVHVTFFGGEPTLQEGLIMETVLYGERLAAKKGKKINFGLVSNFLKVSDEFIRFTIDHGMGWLASYDGYYSQDITRRKGSRDKVVANIRRALGMGARIMVAQQVAPRHTDKLFENMLSVFDLGVNAVFQNPVHHGTTPYDDEDFANIADALDKMSAMIITKRLQGIGPQEFQIANIEKHMAAVVRAIQDPEYLRGFKTNPLLDRTCGACKGSLAIGSDGGIYPCQQMTIEYPQYKMGHVTGGPFKTEIREYFRKEQFDECRNCAVIPCAPCRTQNAYRSGDEGVVPEDVCRYQRLLFYTAINIVNALLDKTPWYTSNPRGRATGPQLPRKPEQGVVSENEQNPRFKETATKDGR